MEDDSTEKHNHVKFTSPTDEFSGITIFDVIRIIIMCAAVAGTVLPTWQRNPWGIIIALPVGLLLGLAIYFLFCWVAALAGWIAFDRSNNGKSVENRTSTHTPSNDDPDPSGKNPENQV